MDILAKAAVVVETKDSMASQTSKDNDNDDTDQYSFNTAREELKLEDDRNDKGKMKVGQISKLLITETGHRPTY